jgi:hypothetical protein
MDGASRRVATVRRYLDSMVARDWTALRETLTDDVRRLGP